MEKKQQPIVAGLGMRTSEMPPEKPEPPVESSPEVTELGIEKKQRPIVAGLGFRTSEMPPEKATPRSPLESLPEVAESAAITWERRFGQQWRKDGGRHED